MSELLSALISIADSSEFRFARFNIVYEGAQLVLPESPPIVSGVSDMRPPGVQTWKRHGIRCSHPAGRIARIFLQRMFHRHSSRNLYHVLLIILFIYYLSLKGAIHGKRQPHKTRRMEDAVRHLLLHHVIYQSVLDVLHCRIIRKIANNLERKRNCSSHSAACDDVSVHNHGVLTR